MVYWNEPQVIVVPLNKDITGISIQVKNAEIKDRDLVDLILRNQRGGEVLNRSLVFDK